MKRLIAALLLSMLVFITIFPSAAVSALTRDTSFEEELATDLKALGLFRGVSETNFDLNRAPTRIEALVMLIRVLGKEQEALNGNWEHPFTDVPNWADKYVGYAYENGLTNGISATEYGVGNASSVMYLTFVLRALGYSDKGGADFNWDNPFSLSMSCGIIPECVDTENFWRADVVSVSYAALPAYLKGSSQTLAEKLIDAGVFSKEQYELSYNTKAFKNSTSENVTEKTKLSATEINNQALKYVGEITIFNKDGKEIGLGTGFIYSEDGKIITNYHVIDGACSAKFSIGDQSYDILGVLAYDKKIDLAVLKIDGTGYDFAKISKDDIAVGSTVYAIGSSRGMTNTFSQGIVTYYNRVVNEVSHIQHDASITNGNSGGPLINEYGEVVGVNTWGIDESQNLNFAVSTRELDNLVFDGLMGFEEFSRITLTSYDYLLDWLLENYNNSESNIFAFEDGGSDYFIGIAYYTDFNMLYIANGYTLDNKDETIFTLVLAEDTSEYLYYASYSNENHENRTLGYLKPDTFTPNEPLSYYSHLGGEWTEESLMITYQESAVLLIEWFETFLEEINIGITIEDFGFTVFSNQGDNTNN